jgi:poly(A) polymerase
VIDYVGGQEDLKNKILRAIGEPNHRFEEDHLRMLRAVRFAARFCLVIDDATADAILSHREHLKRISPERIAGELRLMLTPFTRDHAWIGLCHFKLDQVIFRHLPERGERTNSMGLFINHVASGEMIPFGLALAAAAFSYRAGRREDFDALFDRDEVVKTVNACRTGLKISNEESDLMAGCTGLSALLVDAQPRVATMKRFLAEPFAADARRMLGAIGERVERYSSRVAWLEREFERLSRDNVSPPPFVTGDDLVANGLKPGRLFKRVLDAVYDAQLEDRVRTKAQAMQYAMEIAKA